MDGEPNIKSRYIPWLIPIIILIFSLSTTLILHIFWHTKNILTIGVLISIILFVLTWIISLYLQQKKEVELQLVKATKSADMADTASGVLHNIGNVMNNINTSVWAIDKKIKNSKMENISKLSKLLSEHKTDLASYLTTDKKGKLIPEFLSKLSGEWETEKKHFAEEMSMLVKNLEHVRQILTMQQSLHLTSETRKETSISDILEDALTLNMLDCKKANVEITREYNALKKATIDRVKLLQIVVNLVKNSIESLVEKNSNHKEITISLNGYDESHFIIKVMDNGVGIQPSHLKKIFSVGFTTKKVGHGFGLHASANSAKEMGGRLMVESKGIGLGATFKLILPYAPKK